MARTSDRCPICGSDISREIPHSTFPDLCNKCAEKEVKIRAMGKGTHPNQKRLF